MTERKIFSKEWKLEILFLSVREEGVHHIKEGPIIKHLKININNNHNHNNKIINSNLNIFNSNKITNNLSNRFNINKAL